MYIQDDEQDGDSGSNSTIGYQRFISYGDDKRDDQLVRELSGIVVEANRVDLRGQGYEVEAIKKRQNLQNRQRQNHQHTNSGGGPQVESHPELADQAGMADNFVLPESEENSNANNDPNLQNKLKQKMSQRYGMGNIGGLSKEALEAEYKKKQKLVNKEEPRFRPSSAPRLTR